MLKGVTLQYIIVTSIVLSLVISGCVSAPPPQTPTATPTPPPIPTTPAPTTVTPTPSPATTSAPVATPSVPPTIRVTAYPASVNGDTNFTVRWEVSGGTPGDIGNTGIIWGFKSGGANISDYLRTSIIQQGKTTATFNAELKAPAGGTVYFRAHAIVDGVDIYSPEYQITIIATTGGGY
ncbi:Uncharacterised protein [uncultured archaeon]|nr:Uncharacterised protein [uncultured archaeon]